MNRSQQGFTLIELMVAMLLGLILTLAALQLFMTNQRTFSLQQALAELHEDGQMAIRYMVADIRQAGRGNAVAGSIPAIVLEHSADDTNDSLAIRHWSTSSCAGETYTDQTEVVSIYSVSDGVLQCRNGMTGLTVDLLSGVDSFQVLYGVDATKDGNLGVTQFVTADSDRLKDNSVVVAVRFALLISSDKYRQAQSTSSTHWVLDKETTISDSRLRRTFTSTVQLRNYNWDAI